MAPQVSNASYANLLEQKNIFVFEKGSEILEDWFGTTIRQMWR